MIDVHCHILPGIDDGSLDLEESIEMAKLAASEGITAIIATPHHANGKWINESIPVEDAVRRLNQALTSQDIGLTVHSGQEVRVYRELIEDYQAGKLLRLNHSPYMLIEFPSANVPSYIESLLHEFQVAGITPVIAHPERNQELSRNPDRLLQLIDSGALCQVTSHSINGLFGSKIQSLSIEWCQRNLIHFVSSDAHNVQRRPFQLAAAYQRIGTELGDSYAAYYKRNAEQLFQGEPIDIWEPIIAKKKWYRFWS